MLCREDGNIKAESAASGHGLTAQATEAKAKADSLATEKSKELQVLQEEKNNYVTKSNFFKNIRKIHTGNCAMIVSAKRYHHSA